MKNVTTILFVFYIFLCFLLSPAFATQSMEDIQPIIDSKEGVIGVIIEGTVLFGFFCLFEWLVSIPFKMANEYGKLIVVTNLFTQVILHLLEFLFFTLHTKLVGYLFLLLVPIVVCLEILVVILEFFIYHKRMLGFSTRSIFLYTICANSASLLLGLLIIF